MFHTDDFIPSFPVFCESILFRKFNCPFNGFRPAIAEECLIKPAIFLSAFRPIQFVAGSNKDLKYDAKSVIDY